MNRIPKLGSPTASGYRVSKGFVRKNGSVVQKFFALGHDPAAAIQKILIIEDFAATVPPTEGQLVWTDEALTRTAAALQKISGRTTEPRSTAAPIPAPAAAVAVPVFPPEPPTQPSPPVLTLYQGFDAFVQHTRRRWESRDGIGEETYRQTEDRIASLKQRIPDRPLADIAATVLTSVQCPCGTVPVTRRPASARA